MKKTETVVVPAKPAVEAKPQRTKEVTKTVCDFCGASVPDHGSYGWYPSCSLCGRDCCHKHNHADPDDYTDYPKWFCTPCLQLKVKYRPQYNALEEEYDKAVEKLDNKLKEESLKWQNEEQQ